MGGDDDGISRACGSMVSQGPGRDRALWKDLGTFHFPFAPTHLGGEEAGALGKRHQLKGFAPGPNDCTDVSLAQASP